MLAKLGKSRVLWFLMPEFFGRLSNFVLLAVMARVIGVEDFAVYVAAFAFASLFEPLFANGVAPYVLRLIRQVSDDNDEAAVMRSAYWLLQIVAVIVVAGVGTAESLLFGPDPLSICILLFAMCTPMSLFSLPLNARDQYLATQPAFIAISILGMVLRVGALVLTGNVIIVALLLAFNPICSGVYFAIRTKARPFSRPFIVPVVRRKLLSELPKLAGATFLDIAYWRSPVLLASWFLAARDVVHVALAMQLMMGLCIFPRSMTGSLTGPLVRAAEDRRRTLELCDISSTISFLAGIASIIGVAVFGDFVLVTVFGDKAIGAIHYAIWLSPLAFLAGQSRLTITIVNLHGHLGDLVIGWIVVLAGQVALAFMLWLTHAPPLLAPWTMLSFMFGTIVMPFLLTSLRPFAGHMVLGFRRLSEPRQLLPQVFQVMLTRNP